MSNQKENYLLIIKLLVRPLSNEIPLFAVGPHINPDFVLPLTPAESKRLIH